MIQYDSTDAYEISADACMKSMYNSLEYTTRYLRRRYFFVVLDLSTALKYTNDLVLLSNSDERRAADYTAVPCARSVFGVWIFSYGNFTVVGPGDVDRVLAYTKNAGAVHRRGHADRGTTAVQFDYPDKDNDTRIRMSYDSYVSEYQEVNYLNAVTRGMNHSVHYRTAVCVQAIYNSAQYNEYVNGHYAIVLNLDGYRFDNGLVHYHYKSVRCGGSVFGVWIFKCGGRFTVKSFTGHYDRLHRNTVPRFRIDQSCAIDPDYVKNDIVDYEKIMFTVNDNVRASMDDGDDVIVDFDNGRCPDGAFADGHRYRRDNYTCTKLLYLRKAPCEYTQYFGQMFCP